MNQQQVIELFRECGACFSGHFVLSSGRHSDHYLQSALVLEDPGRALVLGGELAGRLADRRPEVVVGPALGGIIIAFAVARHLPGTRCIFAEREADHFAFRRGFQLCPGQRVLVVEDVITTGASTREVMALVTAAGARVVGVGALAGRSNAPVDFGVPAVTLMSLPLVSWPADDCPLCRAGQPLSKPGSRPGAAPAAAGAGGGHCPRG